MSSTRKRKNHDKEIPEESPQPRVKPEPNCRMTLSEIIQSVWPRAQRTPTPVVPVTPTVTTLMQIPTPDQVKNEIETRKKNALSLTVEQKNQAITHILTNITHAMEKKDPMTWSSTDAIARKLGLNEYHVFRPEDIQEICQYFKQQGWDMIFEKDWFKTSLYY